MRTFIGFEGHYEIYDNGKVVLKLADDLGRCNGKTKKYPSAKSIANNADRSGVLHLLQLMRIYKSLGESVRLF